MASEVTGGARVSQLTLPDWTATLTHVHPTHVEASESVEHERGAQRTMGAVVLSDAARGIEAEREMRCVPLPRDDGAPRERDRLDTAPGNEQQGKRKSRELALYSSRGPSVLILPGSRVRGSP